MARRNGHPAGTPRLDRFGTHREMVMDIPRIKGEGGWPAVVAAFILWDWADARTGAVKASVRGLAAAMGSERQTARNALDCLERLALIRPAKNVAGERMNGLWVFVHNIESKGDNV